MKRNCKVDCRLNEVENELIQLGAQKNNLKLSEFVRSSAVYCARHSIAVGNEKRALSYVLLIDAIAEIEDIKIRNLVRSRLEEFICR